MMNERMIGRETRELVNLLAREANADTVDIFCCDKTSGRGEIFDIYVHGMSPDLKESYRLSRIIEVDPFTDITLREAASTQADGFELATDPRLAKVECQAERYWRFMNQLDVEIVGAATRRYLPGFYLVIGLSRAKRKIGTQDVCYNLLNERLDRLKDMLSSEILTRVLATGEGYGQLRRSLNMQCASDRVSLAVLSPREGEIARLICAGKQNKEIAYLTGLSVHTIENHLKRIYRKFDIHNRAALVSRMQELTN